MSLQSSLPLEYTVGESALLLTGLPLPETRPLVAAPSQDEAYLRRIAL